MFRYSVLVALAWAALVAIAQAETFTALGRTIQLVPPPGFCKLGNSEVERELEQFQRQNTSLAGELAQLAVPCSELSDFKARRIESFTRWVQILVIKPKGQLTLATMSRADFVRGLAGNLADSPPDMAALAARARDHLAKADSSVSGVSARPMGATSEAVFMEIRSTATVGTRTTPVVSIMAITVANQLPIGVYAFATSRSRAASPVDTVRAYLRSVLELN